MDLAELITDTLFLSDTVTSQYREEDIIRNINNYYDDVVVEIWKSDAEWKFDESSEDLPIHYTDLIQDQKDYELPTNARKVQRVEIKYGDNYKRLEGISEEEINVDMEEKTGEPKRYYLKGRSLFLDPVPDKDVIEGLFIYTSDSVTPLEDGDTPAFEREFHRLLSFGAAMDWHMIKGNASKYKEMKNRYIEKKDALRKFYRDKNSDYDAGIRGKRYNYK